MLRRLLQIALSLLGLLVLAFAGLTWSLFHPSATPLPIPEGQIPLGSPEGQALLASSGAAADLAPLQASYVTQETGSWCGVASSVMAINALGGQDPLTQERFLSAPTTDVRSWWAVTFGGIPLPDLAAMLRTRWVQVELHHADDTPLEAFRALAAENLARPGDFVIVNYLRSAVGQEGGGHISPIAAYHPQTDRFLMLDASSYKYPPLWIPADRLWAAMNTTDSETGRSRGFVTVTR